MNELMKLKRLEILKRLEDNKENKREETGSS